MAPDFFSTSHFSRFNSFFSLIFFFLSVFVLHWFRIRLQELKNCGVSQHKTVLNTRGTGRAESTQRQLHVFMALLRVSRLRVSADPQAPEDRLKLLAVKLGVVP